jgi:hypothetical protein
VVGTAVLDRDGKYLELDETTRKILGSKVGSVSFARVPADAQEVREVWWLEQRPEITPSPLVCQLVATERSDRWLLNITPSPDNTRTRETVRRYAERALEEVATHDLNATVHTLTGVLQDLCEFAGCLIVLIDEQTGEPVFAGGEGMAREHLAALEENRRRGAPMVIWQAFAESRIVVKRD